MQKLNLPEYNFKFEQIGTKTKIYDIIRRKYLVLTPEEWVRQNLLHFLIYELEYPKHLIAVEKLVTINNLKQRADIVIYNKGNILMVIECKAPHINITQDTFNQALRYNIKLNAQYIVVSNGLKHYCVLIEGEKSIFLKEIPHYKQLITK